MTTKKIGLRVPRGKWTFEALQAEALKYSTRKAFERGSYGAYQAAHRRGLLDILSSHTETLRTNWTLESLQHMAQQYVSRWAFRKGAGAAYEIARKKGLLDQICGHMEPLYTEWTLEDLQREALRYPTRMAFKNGSYGAYQATHRSGAFSQLCGHMKRCYPDRGLSDVLYVWKVPKRQWFKVGVTRSHRGQRRIIEVANFLGVTPEVLLYQQEPDCLTLEKQLLSIGSPISFTKPFDGATEFRRWTPEQLQTVILEMRK